MKDKNNLKKILFCTALIILTVIGITSGVLWLITKNPIYGTSLSLSFAVYFAAVGIYDMMHNKKIYITMYIFAAILTLAGVVAF